MIDIKKFQLVGVEENKKPMENYMKNRYPFVGVKSPDRKKQSKELITESKLYSLDQLFQTINYLYQKEEREYQNVAIDMCEANVNRLSFEELQNYSQFIQLKSWWDTVDAWRKIYGLYIKRVPEEKEKMFYYFYQHENMWMRRVSITLQLMEKEKTNVELLEKAIMYDRYTDEFFIQKAIGWSLRQYSKVNPNWVVAFTSEKDLLPFAKKEALKQINKQINEEV
ncbi:DNA alkylation repair protein [Vagococcus carniphilus]|uniref:DNA alkylation repair protein n=1 Tax=Vagococcus carniphilus TaxID=218144 RepID=UPI003B5AF9AE